MVSKSEYKKRQKQREQEKKKAAKATTQPTEKAPKKVSAEDEEAELTPNVRICQAHCFRLLTSGSNTSKSDVARYKNFARPVLSIHTPINFRPTPTSETLYSSTTR